MVEGIRCPTCRKPVTIAEGEFPFCSERCRFVDLGRWFSGDYKVSRAHYPSPERDDDIPPEFLDGWEEDSGG